MAVQLKTQPELVRVGSHYFDQWHQGKEELYPVLELELPRVGVVRAGFSCDKYLASSGWTDWRCILREVRVPDPDRPWPEFAGREASGVGPAARAAIDEACAPIIATWLESGEYAASRQRAVAAYIARKIDAPADYTIKTARDELAKHVDGLDSGDAQLLANALDELTAARQLIDAAGKEPAL